MSDLLIIFCANYLILLMVVALAAYAYTLPRHAQLRLATLALLALPLAWILARIAGLFFSHEQPFAALEIEPLIPHNIDNSFPSDHTALAATVAALGALQHRYLGYVLGTAAILVGVARIAALLHHPIDVAVGALLGCLAVWLTYRLSPFFKY